MYSVLVSGIRDVEELSAFTQCRCPACHEMNCQEEAYQGTLYFFCKRCEFEYELELEDTVTIPAKLKIITNKQLELNL